MTQVWRNPTGFLLVAAVMIGCRGTDGESKPLPVEPSFEGLRSELEAAGLQVGEGYIDWEATANCCEWGTCLHINPNGEYGTWALPPHLDEYTEDRTVREDGTVLAGRLGVDEAVLYVGPPALAAAYVSFRTYQHDVADDSGRLLSFANLGDTLNHLAWQINDDGTLLVLTTGHEGTLNTVRDAAASAGWPTVNLDGLPADRVTQGLGAEADTFHTTLRIVGIDDRTVFDAWRFAPEARVWRLTPTPAQAADPLPEATPRPAVAAAPVDYDAGVDSLRLAIVDAHPGWTVQDAELEESEPPLDEASCWAGCNRDVSYVSTPGVPLGEGQKIVAYGVDPAALGRATWTEIVLVGTANNDSAGGVGSAGMAGTAEAWLPGHPDADVLFAWTFARDCGGETHCTEVAEGCPGLDTLELGKLGWRHYLDPATHTFPPLSGLGARGALKLIPP